MKLKYIVATCFFLISAAVFRVNVSASRLLGDVDSDGYVTAADARTALRASVDLEKMDASAFFFADIDHDKSISAADARLILRASVGLEKTIEHVHHEAAATCLLPKTCTECGATEGDALGHDFVNDKCTRCGLTKETGSDATADATVTDADPVQPLSLEELGNISLIDRGLVAPSTDIDTVTTQGWYLCNSSFHYKNYPFSDAIGSNLFVVYSWPTIFTQYAVSIGGAPRIVARSSINGRFTTDWQDMSGQTNANAYYSEHYENTYHISCTPTITADTNNYLPSTGDDTDRTADIQAMLTATGVCRLGPGQFVVSGIDLPENGLLSGCGNDTLLLLDNSVTMGYAVKLASYSCVENLRIMGNADAITLTGTVGTRHGVLWEGTKISGQTGGTTVYRGQIRNCTIANFTGGGVTLTGTGVTISTHALISDCEIFGCEAGIYIPYYSEYHRISNCVCQENYYGCINNGGNNSFSNCDFSMNAVGILIDNSTAQSPNNTHGTYSGCSVNHSGYGTASYNQGTAIRILGAQHGEIFTGMQIFYGSIEIDGCAGIRFIGANMGPNVPITVTDSTVVTFSDCTMYDEKASPLTQSGNTTLTFTECYVRNGDRYDPLAQ